MKIRPILIFSHIFFENSLQFQKLYLPLQPQTRKIGAIAQLVEQRTENPCVPGSIPGGTTKNHSKKMKTSEFQRIQRFSFCFNCAKHADLGISMDQRKNLRDSYITHKF